MENIENSAQKLTSKDIWRRVLLHIPFVLLVIFATALIGGGLLLFIYSIVAVAALKSAMVFVIVFGGGILAIGAGLLCVEAFRLYLAYYNEKEKFIGRPPKTEVKKNIFTLSNISLAIILLGSICVIVSAALGSLEAEKWVAARSSYMQENGYYPETETRNFTFDIIDRDIQNILIDLDTKNAVITYKAQDDGMITVSGYAKFENQITIATGGANHVLSIGERSCDQMQNRIVDKMLFFMFADNKMEAQIVITLPEAYRDSINIIGQFVVAQN